jgi:predicted metal-dependent hydrolase
MLPPIEQDPRFATAVDDLNRGEFFDASEGFEDLFFEAVLGELPFARAMLQSAVGLLHAERGQRRAAVERLEEAIRAIDEIEDARGFDLSAFRRGLTDVIEGTRRHERVPWPRLLRQSAG